MSESSTAEFWIVGVIALVVGLFVGWFVATLLQRRSAGGRSARQLRAEMQSYREEVNEHFARTAELFKESTEKYRDLYEHLAGGAQNLCDDLPDRTQVEFRPGRLLGERAAAETAPGTTNGSDGGDRDDDAASEPARGDDAGKAAADAAPAAQESAPPEPAPPEPAPRRDQPSSS